MLNNLECSLHKWEGSSVNLGITRVVDRNWMFKGHLFNKIHTWFTVACHSMDCSKFPSDVQCTLSFDAFLSLFNLLTNFSSDEYLNCCDMLKPSILHWSTELASNAQNVAQNLPNKNSFGHKGMNVLFKIFP